MFINNIVYAAFMGVKKTPDSSFVVCNKKGRPYRVDADTAFKSALKKAKIANFRFHDLRHTFASQLVMMGSNLPVVQKLLGHKTLQMTERYAHLSPSIEKDTLDKFAGWMDVFGTLSENQGDTEKRQDVGNISRIKLLLGGPGRVRRLSAFTTPPFQSYGKVPVGRPAAGIAAYSSQCLTSLPSHPVCCRMCEGGPGRVRTCDQRIMSPLLYR